MKELVSLLCPRPGVGLAIVYGSVARSDDHPRSDLDLLISFTSEEAHSSASLGVALSEETGRRVQVVSLSTARRAPLLLADVLHQGRVLLDRDDEWSVLKRQEREIQRQATAADAELDRRIAELAELVAGQDH
jgi:predicted nucleotidyltransferase